ncbi:MAG: hypothetical protein KDE04_26905, partial [Anaerolineales bacterium]|nr:hypothetical protein [Anaerolineales bacterium]
FYIAYLMPDIFAPTLLLSAGVLAAFGRDLRGWEIALATFIALSSIVMHPSHLLIAIGLLPVAVAIGLISGLRRWWIGPLALALAAGIGLAERVAIPMAASKISDGAEVVYLPILTARIIVDGPGWDYLEAHCPDADIPTCALYESLSRPGDPMRMTATHIVFETSPELGSYRLLDKETQRRIGQSQTGFFRDVLLY